MRNRRRAPPRGPKSAADYSGGPAAPLDDLLLALEVRRQSIAVHPIVADEFAIREQYRDSCTEFVPELGIRVDVHGTDARGFVSAKDARELCTEFLAERTALTREESPLRDRHGEAAR